MNNAIEENAMKEFLNYLTARSIIIVIISLLFVAVHRIAVCWFYFIPINFLSMDAKELLPAALVVLSFFALLSFTYMDTDVDFLKFLLRWKDRKIHTENKNITAKRERSQNIFWKWKSKYRNAVQVSKLRRKIMSSREIALYEKNAKIMAVLFIFGLVTICLGLFFQDNYSCRLIPNSYGLYSIVYLVSLYFLSNVVLRCNNLLKKNRLSFSKMVESSQDESMNAQEEEKNDEDQTEEKKVQHYIENTKARILKSSRILIFTLILFATLAEEFLLFSCYFYCNNKYKTVDYLGNKYIVIAEDEYYHIAKPVRVEVEKLIIEVDEYLYIEKDEVVVKRIKYGNAVRESAYYEDR